jgi:uncharacterized protein YcnI
MFRTLTTAALFAATAAATTPAFAHVSLEMQEAPIGSTYKAVLRVPHGCDGEATLKLRVRIPEGMIGVKPMPKAGWTLETASGAYGQTYEQFGAQVTEGVVEIVWTGELLNAHYDEFVFRGALAGVLEPGTTLYFPVVQECASGAERWIEIPADGQSSDDLAMPAPGLHLVPARGGH